MDPNKMWRRWTNAMADSLIDPDAPAFRIAVKEYGEELANWINQSGPEPTWNALERRAFFAWWDGTHDETTVYEDPSGDDCECPGPWADADDEGRIRCGECGGKKPELMPGEQELAMHLLEEQQGVISSVLTYLVRQRMARNETMGRLTAPVVPTGKQLSADDGKFAEYRCPECGCPDVETIDWVHLNSGEVTGGDESANYFCPRCDEEGREPNPGTVCLMHFATGECEFHAHDDEPAGAACGAGRKL